MNIKDIMKNFFKKFTKKSNIKMLNSVDNKVAKKVYKLKNVSKKPKSYTATKREKQKIKKIVTGVRRGLTIGALVAAASTITMPNTVQKSDTAITYGAQNEFQTDLANNTYSTYEIAGKDNKEEDSYTIDDFINEYNETYNENLTKSDIAINYSNNFSFLYESKNENGETVYTRNALKDNKENSKVVDDIHKDEFKVYSIYKKNNEETSKGIKGEVIATYATKYGEYVNFNDDLIEQTKNGARIVSSDKKLSLKDKTNVDQMLEKQYQEQEKTK